MITTPLHGNAKLTKEQIADIRALYANGAKQIVLARQFGMCQSAISKIIRGVGHTGIAVIHKYCLDCNTPISNAKQRCTSCKRRWNRAYFHRWYEANRTSRKVRRYLTSKRNKQEAAR